MDYLPEHVMVAIFSRLCLPDLCRVSCVCSYWYHCYHLPDVWRVIKFRFTSYHKKEPSSLLNFLKRHGCHFQDVTMVINQTVDGNIDAACQVIDYLATISPDIELYAIHISLEGTMYPSSELNIFTSLKNLFVKTKDTGNIRQLCLRGASYSFDKSIVDVLADNSPFLESFDLRLGKARHFHDVIPQTVLNLVQKCKYLQTLGLNIHNVSNELLHALSTDDRVQIKRLNIKCGYNKDGFPDLLHSSWTQLLTKSPYLEVSYVIDQSCTSKDVSCLLKPDIPVAEIRLFRFEIDVRQIHQIAEYYSNTLKIFVLSVMADSVDFDMNDVILEFTQKCQNLKSIYVNSALEKETIDTILERFPNMEKQGLYCLSEFT